MTYHTIDFSFADLPCNKRMRPMMTMITPPAAVESFGWGDFPLMTSEDVHVHPLNINTTTKSASISCSTFTSGLEYEVDKATTSSSLLIAPEDDSEDEQTIMTTNPTSLSSTAASPKPTKSVAFDKVYVREHVVVLGVHPLAVGGYPLELGWEYNDATMYRLDDYEQWRGCRNNKPRRLSQLERQIKLSAMHGVDFVESEEKLRKEALARDEGMQSCTCINSADDDNSSNNIDNSNNGYARQILLRCATCTELSRFV